MQSPLPFFPEQASNFAGNVDTLFSFILLTCLFFSVLVTLLIILAALKYKRKTVGEVGSADHGNMVLEVGWTVIPLVIALAMFAWGAAVYVNYRTAPKDTLDIYVVGKQWMWKLQQPNGRKEINELHVPVNRNIKLDHGQRRCDSRFLRSRIPREDGRRSRPLQHHVVPADKNRQVSFLLLAVLRHEPRGDGRLGDGDGSCGVRGVAFG